MSPQGGDAPAPAPTIAETGAMRAPIGVPLTAGENHGGASPGRRGRCLLVAPFEAAMAGDASGRRFFMLAAAYASLGLEVSVLFLTSADPDPARVAAARGALLAAGDGGEGSAPASFAATADAPAAVAALEAYHEFDLIHADAPSAPPWLAARRRALRLVERPGALAAMGRLGDWAPHTDLFIAFDAEEAALCRDAGHAARVAPFLRRAHRISRPGRARAARRSGAPPLAGCWVEAEHAPAVDALFAAIRARGGGAPPRFVLAGPAAAQVAPPPLPHPVLRPTDPVSERVFYRAVDLALFPDLGAGPGRPRGDVFSALELGATPLVSGAGLTGLGEIWRLPAFDDLASMAEYLFERGDNLRHGGLAAELRARADWTWSGLQSAVAAERAALAVLVRDRLAARREGGMG